MRRRGVDIINMFSAVAGGAGGETKLGWITPELKSNQIQSSSTLIPQSLVMGSAVEAGKTMFGDK